MSEFSDWLGDKMHEKGRRKYTQKALARDLDVSEGLVSSWLNGKDEPQGETAVRMAALFGVKPEVIFGMTKLKPKRKPKKVNPLVYRYWYIVYRLDPARVDRWLHQAEEEVREQERRNGERNAELS